MINLTRFSTIWCTTKRSTSWTTSYINCEKRKRGEEKGRREGEGRGERGTGRRGEEKRKGGRGHVPNRVSVGIKNPRT